MAIEIFNHGAHRIIRFDDLTEPGDVQANQFLIIHGEKGMLLDPGGNKMFSKLVAEISKFIPPQKLEYLFLSHQDPDVGAGLNGYLLITDAKICFPEVWERFIPSFCTKSFVKDRVVAIPDRGMRLKLDGAEIVLVPAHFLHSPGNIQVYDPTSKTLFSGDLGASLLPFDNAYAIVGDFGAHVKYMDGFHRRYITSGQACARWATMARALDIERIVPQHGALFEGKAMVAQFIDWIAQLKCGVDLLAEQNWYQIPK
ncbi:MAG: MBL fold metallo-hydrolase [Chloroflexi bacterium]|nr:MBL fold metallo-hydrolase [Chloroflexota bacterium]